jgi:TIR domain
MAKTLVTRQYVGKAQEAVSWAALLRILDGVWGEKARSLPKFPYTIGGIHARWIDGNNVEHEATSLDEVERAYRNEETARIEFSGAIGEVVGHTFQYWPAIAQAVIQVRAPDETTADRLLGVVQQEFPLVARYIFISYATAEYDLAVFLANVVQKRMLPGITVFVAKRDIPAGADPLRTMLEEQLLRAEALLALCSRASRSSPWLWWESSAVWARDQLVIPLFVDVKPEDFGGPLMLIRQGRSLFDVVELNAALKHLVAQLCLGHPYEELTEQEIAELQKFRGS